MNRSIKEKNFSSSGISIVHHVFPVLLAIVLCFYTVQSVQAQKSSIPDKQGAVEITVENSTSPKGAKVVTVMPNSYAQQAGIKPGNIIVKINKTIITSSADFYRATAKLTPGTFIDVGVIQNNTKVTRGVRVANPPGSKQTVSPQEKVAPFKISLNNTPILTITALEISQNIIKPDAVFEISMDLFAQNLQEQNDKVRVTMIYTTKKGEKTLTAGKPENLTLPNGIPVTIIRKCRAQKEAGNYQILIKLSMANVEAEKSVSFIVN